MKSLKKYSKPVILKNGIIYDPFKSKKYKSDILVNEGIIKEISDFTLSTKGGQGVVCELLENIFEINLLK